MLATHHLESYLAKDVIWLYEDVDERQFESTYKLWENPFNKLLSLCVEVFMIVRAVGLVRPMSTLLGRRLIRFLLQLNGGWVGWLGPAGAGEGWEKRGFKGRLILGPMGGSNLSSLIRFFKSHIHSPSTLSATLFGILHHSPKLLVGCWTSLRFISDIWSRHVEVCTTHLVPVCLLDHFLPFLSPAGLSTLSTVHTSYLSLFLHNHNLSPENFTLESA